MVMSTFGVCDDIDIHAIVGSPIFPLTIDLLEN